MLSGRYFEPRRLVVAAFAAGAIAGASQTAAAFEITFDESFVNLTGQIIDNEYATGGNTEWLGAGDTGLTASFSAKSTGGYDRPLVVYDTNGSGGQDPDLEAPFNGQPDPHAGNALIFQEWDGNDYGNCTVGDANCAVPDDQAGAPGTATVAFNKSITLQSMTFFDVEFGENGHIDLYGDLAATNLIGTVTIPVIGNDRYQNVAINTQGVYVMKVAMGGSGAFDSIKGFVDGPTGGQTQVPEPATLSLFGMGLLGLTRLRRRRSA